jgi:hypothetical protein
LSGRTVVLINANGAFNIARERIVCGRFKYGIRLTNDCMGKVISVIFTTINGYNRCTVINKFTSGKVFACDIRNNEIKSTLWGTNCDILANVEQGKGEVLRISLSENYKTTKIMDIKLPAKAIIGVIQRRNRIIIPNGTTQIMGCDDLIIFTLS